MHQIVFSRRFGSSPRGLIALLVAIMPLCGGVVLVAQDQAAPTPNVNAQEPAPAGRAGNRCWALCYSKKEDEPPPAHPRKSPRRLRPTRLLHPRNVPLVEIPVSVTTKDGPVHIFLQKDNFRVYEDGVPQTITNFAVSQAQSPPYSWWSLHQRIYAFVIDALRASYSFASTPRKTNWVAVVSYDIKPQTLVDFTQDRSDFRSAKPVARRPALRRPICSNALYDTLDEWIGSRAQVHYSGQYRFRQFQQD